MPLVEPLTKKKQRSPPQAAAARSSARRTRPVDSRVSSTPPAMATSTASRAAPKTLAHDRRRALAELVPGSVKGDHAPGAIAE